jgi:hypothetical protein
LFTQRILVAALAVVACAVPASASITYYADLPTFTAANVSAQSVSFDTLGLGGAFSSTSLSGLTFTGAGTYGGGNLTVLSNPGGSWPGGDVLARTTDGSGRSDGSITLTLPANVYAVFLDFSYTMVNDDINFAGTAGMDSFSGSTFGHSPGPTTPHLLGFRTTAPITSLVISYPFSYGFPYGYSLQVGGVQFDTVSGSDMGGTGGGTTPESGSLFLMGAGLIALPLLRRRFAGR